MMESQELAGHAPRRRSSWTYIECNYGGQLWVGRPPERVVRAAPREGALCSCPQKLSGAHSQQLWQPTWGRQTTRKGGKSGCLTERAVLLPAEALRSHRLQRWYQQGGQTTRKGGNEWWPRDGASVRRDAQRTVTPLGDDLGSRSGKPANAPVQDGCYRAEGGGAYSVFWTARSEPERLPSVQVRVS
jgi:hypothetical protein